MESNGESSDVKPADTPETDEVEKVVTSPTNTSGQCNICGDRASGVHYKVSSCDGCRGFFKRAVRNGFIESCKGDNDCVISKETRNSCKSCRFKKCLDCGMEPSSVQQRRDRVILKLFDRVGEQRGEMINSSESQLQTSSSSHSAGSNSYHSFMEPPRDYPYFTNKMQPLPIPRPFNSDPTLSYRHHPHFMYPMEERRFYEDTMDYSKIGQEGDDDLIHLHPAYARESWVCIIRATFESMITWLNEVPFLLNLSLHERCLLMETNWSGLFLVSLCKHHMYFDQGRMVSALYVEHHRRVQESNVDQAFEEISEKICENSWSPENTNNLPPSVRSKVKILYSAMNTLYRLREIEQQLVKLDLDSTDLSYLKCLSLMNPAMTEFQFWMRVTRTFQDLMTTYVKCVHEKNESCHKSATCHKIGAVMTTLTSIKCVDGEKIAFAFSPIIKFKEPMDSRFWKTVLSKYRKLPVQGKYT